MEGRRRRQHRRITPQHQHIRLVMPSTPAANAGPRRRARPRGASAPRPLAPVCHAVVWSGVSTAHPRPDGTRCGARRTQRGWGNASGGRGNQRGDSQHIRRRGRNRGERRRREARERRVGTRRHHWRAKGRWGTSRVTPLPRRTYVSRRSTETGYMPTLAPTLTEASATTRRGRLGGVT